MTLTEVKRRVPDLSRSFPDVSSSVPDFSPDQKRIYQISVPDLLQIAPDAQFGFLLPSFIQLSSRFVQRSSRLFQIGPEFSRAAVPDFPNLIPPVPFQMFPAQFQIFLQTRKGFTRFQFQICSRFLQMLSSGSYCPVVSSSVPDLSSAVPDCSRSVPEFSRAAVPDFTRSHYLTHRESLSNFPPFLLSR